MIKTFYPKTNLNKVLEDITIALDITQRQYADAESRYQAVGKFLGDCPKISRYNPQVYPQGSFRLGTVVRPLLDGEEYDIDLVCLLQSSYNQTTQKHIKNLIGDRLKEPQYINQLDREHRRCWRLNYHTESKFHLDIIPAIPDNDSIKILNESRLPHNYINTAIGITDNTSDYYNSLSNDWTKSNPKGYAEWFKDQMKRQLNESIKNLVGLKGATIDDVPLYKIKTPLQRAVQILKRHRDLHFEHDDLDRPISIIITTLSAQAYNNENNIYDALISILQNMESYIGVDAEGNSVITNPVDVRENFADKWIEFPVREENFFLWLSRARMDFESLADISNLEKLEMNLNEALGSRVVSKSILKNRSLFNSDSLPTVLRYPNAIDYSPNEQFIEEQYPMHLVYDLKINCKVKQDGFREQSLNNLFILKKNNSLKFFIQKNSTPKPYEVKWKVRNKGVKAKSHGVRGKIVNDNGTESKTEHSSFYGKHFVECYIIKNGMCVARHKIDVPIAGPLKVIASNKPRFLD